MKQQSQSLSSAKRAALNNKSTRGLLCIGISQLPPQQLFSNATTLLSKKQADVIIKSKINATTKSEKPSLDIPSAEQRIGCQSLSQSKTLLEREAHVMDLQSNAKCVEKQRHQMGDNKGILTHLTSIEQPQVHAHQQSIPEKLMLSQQQGIKQLILKDPECTGVSQFAYLNSSYKPDPNKSSHSNSNSTLRVRSAIPKSSKQGAYIQNNRKNPNHNKEDQSFSANNMTLESGNSQEEKEIEDKAINIESKLLSQSFHNKVNQDNEFEKITHLPENKQRRQSIEQKDVASPYHDECMLALETSSLVNESALSRKRGKKSATSAKKSDKRRLLSHKSSEKRVDSQGSKQEYQRPLPESCFPLNLNFFDRGIFQNPSTVGLIKQPSIHTKKVQINPTKADQSISSHMSSQVLRSAGISNSPNKQRQIQPLRVNSVSKKDIMSCLEIQRLESNRHNKEQQRGTIQVQTGHSSIISEGLDHQINIKKPKTANSVSRRKHYIAKNQMLHRMQTKNLATYGQSADLISPFKQEQDGFNLGSQNTMASSSIIPTTIQNRFIQSVNPFHKNIQDNSGLLHQGHCQMLPVTYVASTSQNYNSKSSEAYQQFQDFKERFLLQENLQAAEDKSQPKVVLNVYANISQPEDSDDDDSSLSSQHQQEDETKFMKNFLNQPQQLLIQQNESQVALIVKENKFEQYHPNYNHITKITSQQRLNQLSGYFGQQRNSTDDIQQKESEKEILGFLKNGFQNQGLTMVMASRGQRNNQNPNPSVSMSAILPSGSFSGVLANNGSQVTFTNCANSGPFIESKNQSRQNVHNSMEMLGSAHFNVRRSSLEKPTHSDNISGQASNFVASSHQKTPSSNRISYQQHQFHGQKNMFLSYFDRKKLQEEQRNILEISTNQLNNSGGKLTRKSLQQQLKTQHNHDHIPFVSLMNFQKLSDAQPIPTTQNEQHYRNGFNRKASVTSQVTSSQNQQQAQPIRDPNTIKFVSPQTMIENQKLQQQSGKASITNPKSQKTIISVQGRCMTASKNQNSTIASTLHHQQQYQEQMNDVQMKEQPRYQPVLQRQRTLQQQNQCLPQHQYQYMSKAQSLYQAKQQRQKLMVKEECQNPQNDQAQPLQQLKNSKLNYLQQQKRFSPSKQPASKQMSKLENPYRHHKINQVLSLANEFLSETFLRPNDQPINLDRVRFICQNFFGIKMPRGFNLDPFLVKSKDFQIQAKEKILYKTWEVIAAENQVPQEWLQAQERISLRKFHIGKGNNYQLVRTILKQRWWWQLCQEGEDFDSAHFIWTSWRKNELIEKLPPNEQLNPQAFLKPSTPLLGLEYQINEALNHQQLYHASSINYDGRLRVYNRLEDNFHLSNKKALFWNMTQFYKQQKIDPFKVLPLTFHIEHGLRDPEFERFKQYFKMQEDEKKVKSVEFQRRKREYLLLKRKIEGYGSEDDQSQNEDEDHGENDNELEDRFDIHVPKNIWILKPGENSNRGQGITVCSTLKDIISEITCAEKRDHTHIIQRYIERPLLINSRKFDIRCFGMLTSVCGSTKGYFYQDGYIRTSSQEFDIEDLHNRFIHLTNDAVQKKSEDYGKFENGNKVSYQNFQKYLEGTKKYNNCNFQKDILPQIRRIVAETFQATFTKVDPQRRWHSFEVFGYDFMLDEDLKVYLIECNTNPCLELSCPLLARIIPAMLDSAFKIALDPLFPLPQEQTALKKNANTLPETLPLNKFELVFDERLEGKQLREMMKGQEAFNLKIDVNEECGDDEAEKEGDTTHLQEENVELEVSTMHLE